MAPTVFAQRRGLPRVGVLHAGRAAESTAIQREPFERGLRELGWVPGSTVIIDYRYAEGDVKKLPQLANELVRSGVDVIVARASSAIDAARAATSTIPIVMSAYPGDPARDGLVKNWARPGGNLTGIGGLLELDGKRLELLKDAFPNVRKVAVVTNPSLDAGQAAVRMGNLEKAAHALKMQVHVFEITHPRELSPVFAKIAETRPDALLVRGDPEVLDVHRADITDRIAKMRLPAIYWWKIFVDSGGLMSYGNSIPAFHHRSANYVDRLLRGAKAADLAIEQPTKFELVINMKTAKALGIEIPKAVTFRADTIVE